MSPEAWTLVISLVGSTVVAAVVSGYFAARNERKKQLLESRRTLAGDLAGDAMGALAALRRYKPPDPDKPGHRNRRLYKNRRLRGERAREAEEAVDALRPARGRVWVTFPGRSSATLRHNLGAQTTSDRAEIVVGALRGVNDICREFWEKFEQDRERFEQDPDSRSRLEQEYEDRYDDAKRKAWRAVDRFADSAAEWLEPRFVRWLRRFRRRRQLRRLRRLRASKSFDLHDEAETKTRDETQAAQ